ncbi:hypothetical protein MKY34_19825 [Sporosarcina sp. FSL K6-1522]|uniref:hypothetical protein n=1 Tax=Sporosarcina sp. FSL K6-1522 TaxID=2921554 RepID=UPI003159CCD7
MIGKVKISQSQADAIEVYLLENDNDREEFINWFGINRKYRNSLNDNYKPLADLMYSDLARALLIGYEVEPEYKGGDWIAFEKVPGSGKVLVGVIEKVGIRSVDTDYLADNGYKQNFSMDRIRHATPEEIKAEKERRVWKSIGREVGQFKVGDAYRTTDGDWGAVISEQSKVMVERYYSSRKIAGLLPAESYVDFDEIVSFQGGDDE